MPNAIRGQGDQRRAWALPREPARWEGLRAIVAAAPAPSRAARVFVGRWGRRSRRVLKKEPLRAASRPGEPSLAEGGPGRLL